jgi:hypothetical protein
LLAMPLYDKGLKFKAAARPNFSFLYTKILFNYLKCDAKSKLSKLHNPNE